jgi:serine protease Do
MKTRNYIASLTFSALLGGGVAMGGYKLTERYPALTQQEQTEAARVQYTSQMFSSSPAVPDGLNFMKASRVATPAVVHVRTEYSGRAAESARGSLEPLLREFFGDQFKGQVPQMPQDGLRRGSGSGVIIAGNGYIVTNNHVIDKASKISVVLDDNRKFDATLVGTDPTTDLALLKIEADNLPSLHYGNSDEIQVGEWVLAVGNPMNLTSTVTAGIVSAKGRSIDLLRSHDPSNRYSIESFIQTDAAVNPGNSGGALVNLNGDLVGINTAIASQTGSFAGYSFAVPSSIVSKVVDDLLKYGEVQRALLGAEIRQMDADFAKEKGLKTIHGVYVANLSDNGAAKEAGLRAGDVITALNGVETKKTSHLLEQVARYRPGDKVQVTYLRDGKENTANVTLKNLNNSTEIVKRSKASAATFEGATFEPVSVQELNHLDLTGGAKITNVAGSKFRNSGMKDGFIITRIDKQPVKEPADAVKLLKAAKPRKGDTILLEGVYSDGLKAFYPIN